MEGASIKPDLGGHTRADFPFVKDYLDDKDGSASRAFDEFYIKTVALGIPVFWDEML